MVARFTAVVLLALLATFQYQLWMGPRSLHELASLREKLAALETKNAEAQITNQQLQAEVDDLRQGLETVEEKARYELNMIAPGETYVQYAD